MKVEQLVSELCDLLDCTQKSIASLIGVTEATLSSSHTKKKEVREISNLKLGRGLESLSYVISTLKRDQLLLPPMIMKILITPCYEMQDETYYSVAAAIQEGDFKNEHLVDIAEAAVKKFRPDPKSANRPPEGSLFQRAFNARS
jgi:hypothetical protein